MAGAFPASLSSALYQLRPGHSNSAYLDVSIPDVPVRGVGALVDEGAVPIGVVRLHMTLCLPRRRWRYGHPRGLGVKGQNPK